MHADRLGVSACVCSRLVLFHYPLDDTGCVKRVLPQSWRREELASLRHDSSTCPADVLTDHGYDLRRYYDPHPVHVPVLRRERLVRSGTLDIFDILSAASTLVLLTWQYLVRIQWSYKNDDGKATTFEHMMFRLRTSRHRSTFKPNKKELEYIVEEAVRERTSFRRR